MKKLYYFLSFCLLLTSVNSCQDPAGGATYAPLQDDLIVSYLEKRPELYSEFLSLLKETKVDGLLSAYGYYTVLAPTNEAMLQFYAEKESEWDELEPDQLAKEKRKVAFDHIISGENSSEVFDADNLPITKWTLTNRFITSRVSSDSITGDLIYSMENAKAMYIDNIYETDPDANKVLDITALNGVVYTVDHVIQFSTSAIADVILTDPAYTIFGRALYMTGLSDSMLDYRNTGYDEGRAFEDPEGTGMSPKARSLPGSTGNPIKTPEICNIGYTILAESDAVLKKAGIFVEGDTAKSWDNLKKYAARIYDELYPEDADVSDITDRRNSLNRFVSYHLLDRLLMRSEFFADRATKSYYGGGTSYPVYEYMETLCPNTILEAEYDVKNGGVIFNKQDGKSEVRIDPNDCDHNVSINGVYHGLTGMLTFEGMPALLRTKRIRIDMAALFPAMATNKLRGNSKSGYLFPHLVEGADDKSFFGKYLVGTQETQVFYRGTVGWNNLDADEFIMSGKYDFTLRLPPVPGGTTWEVRIGYTANSERGVAQIYFDGKPMGIPLNMRISDKYGDVIGADKTIKIGKTGWTEDNVQKGLENLRDMRNRGWMQGSAAIKSGWTELGMTDQSQWDFSTNVRKILLREYIKDTQPHYLHIKSVEEVDYRELMLDYIELVPEAYYTQIESVD